jgi:hypothetical protein
MSTDWHDIYLEHLTQRFNYLTAIETVTKNIYEVIGRPLEVHLNGWGFVYHLDRLQVLRYQCMVAINLIKLDIEVLRNSSSKYRSTLFPEGAN